MLVARGQRWDLMARTSNPPGCIRAGWDSFWEGMSKIFIQAPDPARCHRARPGPQTCQCWDSLQTATPAGKVDAHPPPGLSTGTISGSGGKGSASFVGGCQRRELLIPFLVPTWGQLWDLGSPYQPHRVPAMAQRAMEAVPLFQGFLSCSHPPGWRNRNCFVPGWVIYSSTAYILALSQRRVGGPTWDGTRAPRWHRVGMGSHGGRALLGVRRGFCTAGIGRMGSRKESLLWRCRCAL